MQWPMSICIPSLVYSVGHKILKPICMTLSCSTRDISHKFLNPRERERERERERGIAFHLCQELWSYIATCEEAWKIQVRYKASFPHNPYPCLFLPITLSQGVWYMHLKTENMCLKICVKIHVGGKMCRNTYNVI